MAAGNDKDAALSELADRFGSGVGRAEDLIAASRERYAGHYGVAQLQVEDLEAGTPDLDEVAKTADAEKVLGAKFTKDYVRFVAVDEDGRTFKGAFLRDDLGKAPKTAEKSLEAEDPGDPNAVPESSEDKPKGKRK